MVKSITQLKKLSIAAFLAVAGLSLGGCGDLYERTDFANSVQGKSDAEVQKAVGKPASVDARNPGRVTWTYNSSPRNPIIALIEDPGVIRRILEHVEPWAPLPILPFTLPYIRASSGHAFA